MASAECPLCSGPLEVRETSPCHECGGDSESLARFRNSESRYYSVRLFGGLELILCEMCMVHFGNHDPSFFGRQQSEAVGFEDLEIVREVQSPSSRNDMFCPRCGYRLRFLRFVRDARAKTSP